MSIYTDLHLRKKENLTILRMPGNPYDGMTPQRVILANPENIYNGTFVGTLSTTNAIFNDVALNGGSISGTTLYDATIQSGGQEIDVVELTTDVDQLRQFVSALQKFQTSAEESYASFGQSIDELSISCSQLSSYSNDLSDAISSLSTYVSNLSSTLSDTISAISSSNTELCTSCDWLSGYADKLSNATDSLSGYCIALSTKLSTTISNIISTDLKLSGSISGLSNEFIGYKVQTDNAIDTIQDQIKGGLVYKQILQIDTLNTSIEHSLYELLFINGILSGTPLSTGYLYIAQVGSDKDKISSYNYGGVELTHGDWLIVKNNCYASAITSSDVDVFDAQDYDSFKLYNDNVATGNNTFNGSTTFTSSIIFDAGSTTKFNGRIEIEGDFNFGSNISVANDAIVGGNLSVGQATINDASIKNLSIDLDSAKYANGTSSLQDLSNEIGHQITDNLNKINYLSSQLSDYHNTLSGIDRSLDSGYNDISSDNLIIADVIQPAGTLHGHDRYYMTMISGMVVLKKLN